MNEIHPSAGPQNRTSSFLQHLPAKNLDFGGQSLFYQVPGHSRNAAAPYLLGPPKSSFFAFVRAFLENAFCQN